MRVPAELIGRRVVVTNPDPNLNAEWRGRAVAIAMDPSIIIEVNGQQISLPLAWARLEGDG